jgi:hypothetical protein
MKWLVVLGIALALDLGIRFGLHPAWRTVLLLEGLLFFATAAVVLWLGRRDIHATGWGRRGPMLLAAAMALGGTRVLVWWTSGSVELGNAVIVTLAAVGLVVDWRRRRARRGGA